MNEEAIVTRLKEEAERKAALVTTSQPEPVEAPKTDEKPGYAAKPPAGMPAFELMGILGVPQHMYGDRTTQEQMQYIYNWAAEGRKDVEWTWVLQAIRGASSTLGLTLRDDTRFQRLYEYAKLDMQRKNITAKMGML